MPAGAVRPSSTVRALAWAEVVERQSAVLPRRRLWSRGSRDFVHQELLTFRADLDPDPALPVRGLFVDQGSGATLLRADDGVREQAGAACDVVLVGTLRQPTQLRFRSFYLAAGLRRARRSLVLHQRRRSHLAMPLASGAQVQREVAGGTAFLVPRLLDTGTFALPGRPGTVVADWAVEEALDGARIRPDEADGTVHELAALLAETCRRLGVEQAPVDALERTQTRTAFEELVRRPPTDGWPPDLDPHRVGERVRQVLAEDRLVTVGFSHGDPGLNNVVRMRDGRLALVDWEDAGRRMLAHDLIKVARSGPDPLAAVAELARTPPVGRTGPGVAPWPEQLALSLLLFLRPWQTRHARALKLGRPGVQRRRLHTSLQMVALLLDAR